VTTDAPDPGTGLAAPQPKIGIPALVSSDDEIRRCWRLAEGLHASGMFKVGQASQAFAKILIGRDIGISPTQALMTIDIVNGSIFMRGVLLAAHVRKSPQYDYTISHHDDKKCVVMFSSISKATGQWREDGPSEFTMEEAAKQGLTTKDSWKKTPKNMLFWRAISNGVKFYCPDLLGGVPVYTEADPLPEPTHQLGAGNGTGEAAGIPLPPAVEEVIARATELGHSGLSNRGTIEMDIDGQPEEYVQNWVRKATSLLDEVASRPVDGEAAEESS
jgi:hypothetical protein